MSHLAEAFVTGLREAPALFFAPVVGAVRGICTETRRVLQHRPTQMTPAPLPKPPRTRQ
jgi:hypothetical protein